MDEVSARRVGLDVESNSEFRELRSKNQELFHDDPMVAAQGPVGVVAQKLYLPGSTVFRIRPNPLVIGQADEGSADLPIEAATVTPQVNRMAPADIDPGDNMPSFFPGTIMLRGNFCQSSLPGRLRYRGGLGRSSRFADWVGSSFSGSRGICRGSVHGTPWKNRVFKTTSKK